MIPNNMIAVIIFLFISLVVGQRWIFENSSIIESSIGGERTSAVVRVFGDKPAFAFVSPAAGSLSFALRELDGQWNVTSIIDTGVEDYTPSLLVNGAIPSVAFLRAFSLIFAQKSTATAPWTLETASSVGGLAPAMLQLMSGTVIIFHFSINQSGSNLLATVKNSSSSAWSANQVVDAAVLGSVSLPAALVNSLPSIVYMKTAQQLHFATADDGGATSWTSQLVYTDMNGGGSPSHFSLVGLSNGAAALTFQDQSELKFARRAAAGANAWTVSVVDAAGDLGYSSSLALISGRIGVAFFKHVGAVRGELQFAEYTNNRGTGGQWQLYGTIDGDGGRVEDGCSLMASSGGDGPLIVFRDRVNSVLRVITATAVPTMAPTRPPPTSAPSPPPTPAPSPRPTSSLPPSVQPTVGTTVPETTVYSTTVTSNVIAPTSAPVVRAPSPPSFDFADLPEWETDAGGSSFTLPLAVGLSVGFCVLLLLTVFLIMARRRRKDSRRRHRHSSRSGFNNSNSVRELDDVAGSKSRSGSRSQSRRRSRLVSAAGKLYKPIDVTPAQQAPPPSPSPTPSSEQYVSLPTTSTNYASIPTVDGMATLHAAQQPKSHYQPAQAAIDISQTEYTGLTFN